MHGATRCGTSGGPTSSTAAARRDPHPSPVPAGASGAKSVPRTEPGQPPGATWSGGVREAVRTLNPGYFALVMATGIVSIAMQNHRLYALSVALLWMTVLAYAVLLVLCLWRLAAF